MSITKFDDTESFLKVLNLKKMLGDERALDLYPFFDQLDILLKNSVDLPLLISGIKSNVFPFNENTDVTTDNVGAYQFVLCLLNTNSLEGQIGAMCKNDFVEMFDILHKYYGLTLTNTALNIIFEYDSIKLFGRLIKKTNQEILNRVIYANSQIILSVLMHSLGMKGIDNIITALLQKKYKSFVSILRILKLSLLDLMLYIESVHQRNCIPNIPAEFFDEDDIIKTKKHYQEIEDFDTLIELNKLFP